MPEIITTQPDWTTAPDAATYKTDLDAAILELDAEAGSARKELDGLGTAAVKDVGTAPGNVVQLDEEGKLPAVDGSALTGLPEPPTPVANASYVSPDQEIVSAGLVTLAHGMEAAPKWIQVELVCDSAEAGYSAGDVIQNPTDTGSNQGFSIVSDATYIKVRYGSAAQVFETTNFSNGVDVDLTNSKWRMRVRAFA